ncbi:MAG: hypothetical protein KKC11_05170 [Candidatus Omnitrophica bacterium]|nr:hypothetical protein [Candidatus Omnitrophota bacterium]
MNKMINKKKSQAFLEAAMVFISLALLSVGAMKVFSDLNLNMVDRLNNYKGSRGDALSGAGPSSKFFLYARRGGNPQDPDAFDFSDQDQNLINDIGTAFDAFWDTLKTVNNGANNIFWMLYQANRGDGEGGKEHYRRECVLWCEGCDPAECLQYQVVFTSRGESLLDAAKNLALELKQKLETTLQRLEEAIEFGDDGSSNTSNNGSSALADSLKERLDEVISHIDQAKEATTVSDADRHLDEAQRILREIITMTNMSNAGYEDDEDYQDIIDGIDDE